MNPETLFTIANVAPMPVWLTWMLAPRSRAARYLATSLFPWAILGALYVSVMVIAFTSGGSQGNFQSLAGVMALFQSPWVALAGWVHYLAFDLFVARWIMNDAPEAGYRLLPILVLTLMGGPAGLLVYLAARRWLHSKPAAAHVQTAEATTG